MILDTGSKSHSLQGTQWPRGRGQRYRLFRLMVSQKKYEKVNKINRLSTMDVVMLSTLGKIVSRRHFEIFF